MRKLTKQRRIVTIIGYAMATITAFGFIMMIGGIGNFDLAAETHTIMSHEEEVRSILISIVGLILMGVGTLGVNIVYQIVDAIDRNLRYRRRKIYEGKI